MPVDPDADIVVTGLDWAPPFAQGLVRDIRARWALEEVGRAYCGRPLRYGDQKEAAHRARQPFGQVPTYEEGEVTLFESGAIVLHIAQVNDGLLPAGAAERADATGWLFAALNTVEPAITDLAFATIFERHEPWSKPRIPSIKARIREQLAVVSERLGDADWLGTDFSAGDLMLIAVLRQLRGSRLVEEYPNLAAYVARGEARPAFKRALADQLAGFTGEAPPEFAEWNNQGEQK